MQLFVQGHALHTFNVSEDTTVEVVKEALATFEGIPTEEQLLVYGGVPLEGETLLCDSVPELATLSLSARVVGGLSSGTLCICGCCVLFKAHL